MTEEGGGGGERRARCPVAGRRRGRQGCRDAPHVGLQLDAELAQWQLPAFRLPGERTSQQQLQPLEGGGERPAVRRRGAVWVRDEGGCVRRDEAAQHGGGVQGGGWGGGMRGGAVCGGRLVEGAAYGAGGAAQHGGGVPGGGGGRHGCKARHERAAWHGGGVLGGGEGGCGRRCGGDNNCVHLMWCG